MAYADFDFYASLYGEPLDVTTFNRLAWDASRYIERATTGVDGVKKLKVAPLTDESDIECLNRCVCALIHAMYQVEQAQNTSGYVTREDGTIAGKVISSVSSGTESISYAAGVNTAYTAAAADNNAKNQLYFDIVTQHLSGITDANGVNLLYMGPYTLGV